ncbi:MAG: aspartate carbamoyltransferase catalytic subunit [Proteobacteria bacterium]|jgi:aspartate carbamoyltransferase catalytic subunit|nr:aspartate carbamoyltransferase catalytic subunit [Pseudomonadota bacterium]MCC6631771.1 aspartate carbamoyltransferase catalytic subunit [Gammaproteobacteria bacterium]
MALTQQRRADGSLRHLLTLEGLTRDEIESLLERAQHHVRRLGEPAPHSSALAGVTVANMFTEPSTRTRVSFELAAKRLGADVVNLEVQLSSRVKGESMLDTVFTLEALHVDVFVLRDAEQGVPAMVASHVAPHVSVLSAGEAHVSHPTQGLLDALTVLQHKKRCDGLAIAIVGDIRHSRVARSACHALRTLGTTDIRIVAPEALMPDPAEFEGCARSTSIETGIEGADVVMMLRIQKERFANTTIPAGDDYFREFGLTAARLAKARPDAIVMHPQPMNRGVEIDGAVADGPRSVIRQQVTNGVAVRMAALEILAAPLAARRAR